MILVVAYRRSPTLTVVKSSLCATDQDRDEAALDLCREFSGRGLRVRALDLPAEPMPSFTEVSDPEYLSRIHAAGLAVLSTALESLDGDDEC